MKNKNQSGSAHAIIVILLVLALIGSLGFIFWQNFAKNETNKQTQTSQKSGNNKTSDSTPDASSNEVELTEVAADNIAGTNLAIKYPSNWTMTHEQIPLSNEGGRDFASEKYAISSPDTKTVVDFVVSNAGFGGMCEKAAGDEILYISTEKIPNYSTARFVSYYGKGYFGAEVQKDTTQLNAIKVGDSMCDLGVRGIMSPIKSNTLDNVNLILRVNLSDNKDQNIANVEKFKQFIKTEDFKTAKSIVESLYVKN